MLKIIVFYIALCSSTVFGQSLTQQNIIQGNIVADPSVFPYGEFLIDRIIYRDNAYSSAQKTQLGDQVELEMGIRYQKDENSFVRFRFATDPTENRKDNETSRFEIIYHKTFRKLSFQFDLGLDTNDPDSGGTNLGLDIDSDDTFLSYQISERSSFTFYPFNFRTDVGDEFNTRDVTRISYIEGSPTSVLSTPTNDEEFITKTIPGIEVGYNLSAGHIYAGVGVASYLYPTNDDYDIEDNPSADAWERKEASAFKSGYVYTKTNDTRLTIQYVQHDKTEETGAILKSAASIVFFKNIKNYLIKTEITQTTAGDAPLNLSRSTGWIEDVALNKPIYSDINGEKQDWIGETDQAYGLKLGVNLKDITPYLSFKYQGPNFIYRDRESAHRLRIDDESEGHGGLTRVGLGGYFYYENLFFNPQLEWQQAKNPVFSNSTDVSNDRLRSSFKKENIVLTLNVNFSFDSSNLNQNWWF